MKKYFLVYNKIYSDRSELDLSNETIRIQKFYFSRKLWWKNCLNWIAQIEDLNGYCAKISRPYLLYFPINKLSKSVTVGPVHRFDSTNAKMIKKNWMFECRRGYLCIYDC